MNTQTDSSVINMWNDFIRQHPEYQKKSMPEAWYFCDTKKDANECADLVIQGIKQATSTSLWWYTHHNYPIPIIGDLAIVTDWDGKAQAIIETTKIEHVAYKDVSEKYAAIEGEGDKSLAYWKKVHWAYYTREMEPYGAQPSEDMIIICEQFKTIWSTQKST